MELKKIFNSLFERSHEAVLWISGYSIIYCNRKACRLFGANKSEIEGRGPWQISPRKQEDGGSSIKKAKELIDKARKKSVFFEWKHKGKKGEFFTEVTLNPVNIGGKDFVQAIMRDITERKISEEKLKNSEEIFRALTENSEDIIMRFDRDLRHLYVNPAMKIRLGMDPEKMIGKTHEELGFPQYLVDKWHKALRKVFRTGEMNHIEFTLPNGPSFDWMLAPEFDNKGTVKAVITSARDITKRKKTEKKLKESEEKFRIFTDSAPVALLIHRGGNWLYANSEAIKLLGYNRDELLSMHFISIVHPDYRNLVLGRAKSREKGRGPKNEYEIKAVTKKGKERWVNMRVEKIIYEGQPSLMVSAIDITERKEDEEKIERANEFNKEIIDKSPFGIYTVNSNGDVDYVNKEMLKIAGAPKKKFMELNMLKLPGYKKIGLDKKVRNGLEGNYFKVGPLDYTSSISGKKTTRIFTGIPLKGKEENKLMVIVDDVTERKKAEMKLKNSEEKFRMFTESAPVPILIHRHGNWLYANNEASRALGYSKKELLSMTFMDVVHPDHKGMILKRAKAREKGGQPKKSYELKVLTKQGKVKWFNLRVEIINYAGKRSSLISGQDITGKKEAEEKLRKEKERYMNIFREYQDLYFETDFEGVVKTVSPSLKDLGGYEPSDVIGKSVFSIYRNPSDRKPFMETLKKEGKVKGYEVQLLKSDGGKIDVSINAHLVYDKDKKPVKIAGVMRDITERKRYENQLKEKVKMLNDFKDNAVEQILELQTIEEENKKLREELGL
ncbi:MAG: PAS domain S-box protein [Nanobdellota archaeon]